VSRTDRHLRILEYGLVHKSDVGARAFRELQRFDAALAGRNGTTVLDWSHPHHAKAGSMVGVLSVPGLTLEILPKLDRDASGTPAECAHAQRNLLAMMRRAGWIRFHNADLAALSHESTTLLDVHAWIFARRLREELNRGLDRAYITRRENMRFLRGRLIEPEHSRRNLVLKHSFFVEHDELAEDHRLNHTLKAATRILLRQTRHPRPRALLASLLEELTHVSDLAPSQLTEPVHFHRNNERYRPLYNFARSVLAHHAPAPRSGTEHSFSLLIPMEVLFEEYFGRLLKWGAHRLGLDPSKIHLQAKGHSLPLLRDLQTNRDHFHLKPDVYIEPHGEFAGAVLDTKWKLLDPTKQAMGVRISDVYQVLAYRQRYKVPLIGLVHPGPAGQGQQRYRTHCDGDLRVSSLPCGSDAASLDEACLAALREILSSTISISMPRACAKLN